MAKAMAAPDLAVVLVGPRFPENIGMVARACANMGCSDLRLVRPERWDFLKAEPLATAQGIAILKNLRIHDSLAAAIVDCESAWATSARCGSRRGKPRPPDIAAQEIAACAGKTALVFGPEDRGLANDELGQCQRLIRIRTAPGASSLNLAQAVLIVLYECAKAATERPASHATGKKRITVGEWQLLAGQFRQMLGDLDCLAGRSPERYFQQWSAILRHGDLSRQEYDTLMGFCRQVLNKLGR